MSFRSFPVWVSGNRCPWQCTPAWTELDGHTSHIRIISVEVVVALCSELGGVRLGSLEPSGKMTSPLAGSPGYPLPFSTSAY